MGTCKFDPDRQENSCDCHMGKKCKVWDQIGPCNTSYNKAPPSAKALRQLGRIQEEGSIASTASTVTCTADSLRQTCQGLKDAMAAREEKADALVLKVEEEEDTMDVSLQHLLGLSVHEIRAAKQKAASETEAVIEEAEPLIQAMEE